MVEGQPQALVPLGCPSTSLRLVPLPVPGRNYYASTVITPRLI